MLSTLTVLHNNLIIDLFFYQISNFRESVATFDNLCETFPDENCVLTNREIFVEVRISGLTFLTFRTLEGVSRVHGVKMKL